MLQGDRHSHVIMPLQAIGDHHRGIHGGIGEAVGQGRLQVVDGISPAAGIEGTRISQERFAPGCFDLPHDLVHELRPDEGQIASLAEMELHRHQVPWFNQRCQTSPVEQVVYFVQQVISALSP